jgi:hypothetical protein
MNARADIPAFEIHPRNPLRLRVSAGRHLSSVAGTAWVTIDGDLRDIILEPGDSHEFDQAAHVMVQAMGGDAQLVAEDGVEVEGHRPVSAAWRALWQRLGGAKLG